MTKRVLDLDDARIIRQPTPPKPALDVEPFVPPAIKPVVGIGKEMRSWEWCKREAADDRLIFEAWQDGVHGQPQLVQQLRLGLVKDLRLVVTRRRWAASYLPPESVGAESTIDYAVFTRKIYTDFVEGIRLYSILGVLAACPGLPVVVENGELKLDRG